MVVAVVPLLQQRVEDQIEVRQILVHLAIRQNHPIHPFVRKLLQQPVEIERGHGLVADDHHLMTFHIGCSSACCNSPGR